MLDEEEMEKVINPVKEKKKPSSLYLHITQEKLKNAIESGLLNVEQQYGMIDSVIYDLLGAKLISEDAAMQHYTEIKNLNKEIEERQVKASDRYKKTYEGLLKL